MQLSDFSKCVQKAAMIKEIWKNIENYEYRISNKGRVWSLKSNIWLKPRKSKYGYYEVNLYNENGVKMFRVNRLVAQTFIPNPENKPEVNHKDGNKQNNDVDNLEWCTISENKKYNFEILGYKGNRRGKFGINNCSSKSILQYDLCGKFIKKWNSIMDVERELGINHSQISAAALGKQKISHYFIWQYERTT